MAQLVTPPMGRQGGGAIVNVSTYAAFEPEEMSGSRLKSRS
jgi:hypothetical protein